MKNIGNRFYGSSHDIKLKIFWTQCISLLFLIFVISFALNIFYFNVPRLMLEIALVLGIIIMLILSYKTKKVKPYNYLMLIVSNFFIITLLIILDEMSKVTVFSYFSILILFTMVLFEKVEKIVFVVLECLVYSMFAYFLITAKDVNFVVYNMLIQIFISTCTIVASFLTVLKMYEVNAINLQQINNELKSAALKDSLTDLWNRQYMERLLDEMIPHRAQNFSIVLFDIDHFKQINDTYGHPMGG